MQKFKNKQKLKILKFKIKFIHLEKSLKKKNQNVI